MSWAAAVEGSVKVALGLMGLRADFGFVVGGLGLWALRAARGSLMLDREGTLQDVPLMMLLMGSLNWTIFIFAAFLKLLGETAAGRGNAVWLVQVY